MTDILQFVRTFPEECCAEVSRKGESQPCGGRAVAVAVDADEGYDRWWPVCAHHSRGRRMVALSDLIEALGR